MDKPRTKGPKRRATARRIDAVGELMSAAKADPRLPPSIEFNRWINARLMLRKRNPEIASLLNDARTAGDPELWDRTARKTVRAAADVGTAVILKVASHLIDTRPSEPSRRVWKDLQRTVHAATTRAVVEFIERQGPTHPSVDELAATFEKLAPIVEAARAEAIH